MKYVIRYAALAMAMLSGTAFLSAILCLLRAYDSTQHRFAPVRVSPPETLFVGITCVAFAGIYQLMVGSKSDPISKTQTEIKLVHIGFLSAWFCLLFMVHSMNPPVRSVSVWVLAALVFASVYVVLVGFVTRKKILRRSGEALPGDIPKALKFWKSAHFIGFGYAMNLALFGFVLKFLGSNWLVPGILFGLSLGFLLLWRPRKIAGSDVQPA